MLPLLLAAHSLCLSQTVFAHPRPLDFVKERENVKLKREIRIAQGGSIAGRRIQERYPKLRR